MKQSCWWLVDKLSRTLQPDERDAVRGDLAESGVSGGQALRDLVGLVVRRQAALWKDWRPWLALVGIVGLVGALLFNFSVYVSRTYELYFWIIWNYSDIDPALLEETGMTVQRGIVRFVRHSLLLISWSWTGGFVLGSLSRRATWVNGAFFALVWLFFLNALRFMVAHQKLSTVLFLSTVLCLLPFIWGVRQGLRHDMLSLRRSICLAAAIASITAWAIWTGGWWRGGPWQTRQLYLSLILCWPVAYLVAAEWSEPQK